MSSKAIFSEREMKVMAAAWQCMPDKPKIDMSKLASLTGYASSASASNAWRAIQDKLRGLTEESDATEAAGESTGAAPSTPQSKRKPGRPAKSGTHPPTNTPAGSPTPAARGHGGKRAREQATNAIATSAADSEEDESHDAAAGANPDAVEGASPKKKAKGGKEKAVSTVGKGKKEGAESGENGVAVVVDQKRKGRSRSQAKSENGQDGIKEATEEQGNDDLEDMDVV